MLRVRQEDNLKAITEFRPIQSIIEVGSGTRTLKAETRWPVRILRHTRSNRRRSLGLSSGRG
jgi:hypothetical protein